MSSTAADPRRSETRPSPGSPAAVGLGCRCPVLVNGPAAPSGDPLIAPDCTLHSVPED